MMLPKQGWEQRGEAKGRGRGRNEEQLGMETRLKGSNDGLDMWVDLVKI